MHFRSPAASAARFENLGFFAQPIVAIGSTAPHSWFEMLARPDPRSRRAETIETMMSNAYSDLGPSRVDLMVLSRGFEQISGSGFLDRHPDSRVSFNVHPASVLLDGFADQLLDLCNNYRIPPSRVCLELVEYCGRHELVSPAHGIEKLRAKGVRLALDDLGAFATHASIFASGYLDYLKLDKSILHLECSDRRLRNLVSGLHMFCRAVGAELIVEGVETQNHMNFVTEMGVDWAQGYYIAPPAQPCITSVAFAG